MSLTAAAIRILASKGLTLDDIIQVAEANAAVLPVETSADRRRRLDRERKRDGRVSAKSAENGGQNADGRHDDLSAKSAEFPQKSAENCGLPHARVEDINPTKVLTGISLSLERVRECAGDAIASMATHPGIANLAPLTSLLTADPPCEPDEVYGAVSAAAAWHRQRGGAGSMTGWTVARKIALENRDRRLAGAPVNERPHHNSTNAADRRRADTESRRNAWADAAALRAGIDPRDDERGGSGGDDRGLGGYLRLAHPLAG